MLRLSPEDWIYSENFPQGLTLWGKFPPGGLALTKLCAYTCIDEESVKSHSFFLYQFISETFPIKFIFKKCLAHYENISFSVQ